MQKSVMFIFLLFSIYTLSANPLISRDHNVINYQCVVGYNMVGLPFDRVGPLQTELNFASDIGDAFPGMIDAINIWDPGLHIWITCSYLIDMWDGDFPVKVGDVLMINALQDFTFTSIMVDSSDSQFHYELLPGLNTVLIPDNHPELYRARSVGESGDFTSVGHYDNAEQEWVYASMLNGIWNGDFPVYFGLPLMVYSTSNQSWLDENIVKPQLQTNYPNPFINGTVLRYKIKNSSPVKLDIYNIKGEFVVSLVNDIQTPGRHSSLWTGKNSRNQQVSAGVYVSRLRVGNHSESRLLVKLK